MLRHSSSFWTFPFLTSFSTCDVVIARIDWVADNFVWARIPNGKFRPGEKSSVPVLARPPNRRCCHPLWYAELPNRQLYSGPWVGLRWETVPMAPVTVGYSCRHAESHFFGLLYSLLRC